MRVRTCRVYDGRWLWTTPSKLSTMLHVSTYFSTFSAFSFNECALVVEFLALYTFPRPKGGKVVAELRFGHFIHSWGEVLFDSVYLQLQRC